MEKYRLLCIIDDEPQVLTRVFHTLVKEHARTRKITEVHVIATGEGKRRIEAAFLSQASDPCAPDDQAEQHNAWLRCLRSLGLRKDSVRFDQTFITELSHEDGSFADDVLTEEHNEYVSGLVLRKIAALTSDEQGLHVCVSDGRHSIAIYVSQALSLLGRAKDELTNLVVTDVVEDCQDFYFPDPSLPPVQVNSPQYLVRHSDIRIELCDVPFVRLRGFLSPQAMQALMSNASLAELAIEAQTSLSSLQIELECDHYRVWINRVEPQLEPRLKAFLYWIAHRRKHLKEHWVNPQTDISPYIDIYLSMDRARDGSALKKSFDKEELTGMMSRIKESIRADHGEPIVELLGKLSKRASKTCSKDERKVDRYAGYSNYGLFEVNPEMITLVSAMKSAEPNQQNSESMSAKPSL